jgi:tetratricopeptide (TPR) repeat protein
MLEMQKLHPDDLVLLEKMVEPLSESGRQDTAVALTRAAAGRFPREAAAHRALGLALLKTGQFDQGHDEFKQAVQLAPDTATNWLGLSQGAGFRHRPDEAIAAASRAVQLAPEVTRMWQALVDAYRGQSDLLAAEVKLKELLAEFPDAAPGWFCLGALQIEGGMRQIGLSSLRKAVVLKPGLAEAWNTIGATLLNFGTAAQRSDAIRALEYAVKADARHAEAWNNLGLARSLDGKLAPAIEAFQAALRGNPKHSGAMVNLTRSFSKQGSSTEAKQTCDRLATIDPKLAGELRAELHL